MVRPGPQENYRQFIEWVRVESHKERLDVNRRMLSVFIWCFILPAIAYSVFFALVRLGVAPNRFRGVMDWIILIFPVAYSVYFLSSEVIAQLPEAFRRGALATSLGQAVKQGEWREKSVEYLKKNLHLNLLEWQQIQLSFEQDLNTMLFRARYLTALAGAIFFLITQGIDFITDGGNRVTWVKDPMMGWVELTTNDFNQYVALALFLVLLYLSGVQTHQSLKRFKDCVDLLILDLKR